LWPSHASRRAQPESDGVGAGELGAQVVEAGAPVVVRVTGLAAPVVVLALTEGVVGVVVLVVMARAGYVVVAAVAANVVVGALREVEAAAAPPRPAPSAERPHPPSSKRAARKMSALGLMYK